MTVSATAQSDFTSRLIKLILGIKPLANFAKAQARQMMIKRAEKIGVPWRETVQQLRQHDWETEQVQIHNPQIQYPDYYLTSFHAYETGNLSWEAALEVECAAYAVHAQLWGEENKEGDRKLRQSYHDILKQQLEITPQSILDLGCSVGMSSFTLQDLYPQAQVTGLDLSSYYLAVAQYQNQKRQQNLNWVHAPAENTGLPSQSFDLISACLMFHEIPQAPAFAIFQEARRLLRPGGYFTIMDMNPDSEAFQNFPPYVFTLLKSTEPYLDDYMTLDLATALTSVGFETPYITSNSPRHRTVIARAK